MLHYKPRSAWKRFYGRTRAFRRGGQAVSRNTMAAVDALVKGLKADGLWPLLDVIAPLAGPNLASCLILLKHPLGVGLSMTGSNLVAADYVESSGITGNGSNKFINTNYNVSNYHVAGSQMMAVFLGNGVRGSQTSTAAQYCDIGDLVSGGSWLLPINGSMQPALRAQGVQFTTGFLPFYPFGLLGLQMYSGTMRFFSTAGVSYSAAGTLPLLGSGIRFCFRPHRPVSLPAVTRSVLHAVAWDCRMWGYQTRLAARAQAYATAMGRMWQPTAPGPYIGAVIIGQSLSLGATATAGSGNAGGNAGSCRTFIGGWVPGSSSVSAGDGISGNSLGTVAGSAGLQPFNDCAMTTTTPNGCFITLYNLTGVNYFVAGNPVFGQPYSTMQKGTQSYANAITQAGNAYALITKQNGESLLL